MIFRDIILVLDAYVPVRRTYGVSFRKIAGKTSALIRFVRRLVKMGGLQSPEHGIGYRYSGKTLDYNIITVNLTMASDSQGIAQPNATLYVKNIDWKIKKTLLRRALYSLFSRHGKVLEMVTLRRDGLRGQAWIIFEDVQAATAALKAEQGFTFFGKDMVIEYARETSDCIARKDGTYVPKAKRQKVDKVTPPEEGAGDGEAVQDDDDEDEEVPMAEGEKEQPSAPSAPPSKYLLAEDLPSECNEMMMSMLFRQYAGYKEVRMPRPGLAFVEFDNEAQATLALQGLNGFNLTTKDTLKLTYGKA
jgi:U2 small nuclear ribonucleoprotein B''